jgi:DNA-directed RNA polymerase subunit beta'
VVLGLYYATRERINAKGEGMIFADLAELQRALDNGVVELTAKVSVRLVAVPLDKATGEFTPFDHPGGHHRGPRAAVRDPAQGPAFRSAEQGAEEEGNLASLINASFRKCGLKETVVFADKLLQNGFRLATRAGISIAWTTCWCPRKSPASSTRAERK